MTALLQCPKCQHKVLESASSCPECGLSVAEFLALLEVRKTRNRLLLRVAMVPGSWLAGRMAASFVWVFIYGIGSAVIEDETYAELRNAVATWGGFAGVLTGFVAALLFRRPPALQLLAIHGASLLAGCAGGAFGWRTGLCAYFCVHAASIIGLVIWALTRRLGGLRTSA